MCITRLQSCQRVPAAHWQYAGDRCELSRCSRAPSDQPGVRCHYTFQESSLHNDGERSADRQPSCQVRTSLRSFSVAEKRRGW